MKKTDKQGINHERFIPMPGINRFYERLEIAMNGMSNVALATKCNISESAIRSYLKGRSYPGIDKIQPIADACNSPMTWLITGEVDATFDEGFAKYSETELSLVLGMMTDEQRKILVSAIFEYGVSGIVSALNGMAAVTDFMRLSENERAQVLRVYEQIKEGASQGDSDAAQRSLTTNKRQAG
ncbi:helix-turn-helix domain-containing protein [Dickeya solani]|uniref:Helix-turn-helix domain-containing protein n=1 Tax=Dickeya solani TaxID=1089444 RepID=A0AAX4F0Q7_9GAMM|nr:helix-turn-helix domain-containing protein [Dickeya solani]WOA52532.1 helix-turn-helix domain-containing protein [Dickeya solani]